MKKQDKARIVQELNAKAGKARFFVLTDFRGVTVEKMGELRTGLRETGAEYQVVKNTLLLRASEGTDLSAMKEHFRGPCALMLCYGDPVPPAKVLTKFAKDNPKVFAIKAGVLAGKAVDPAEIKTLAELPPKEVLQAQVLGAINGVASGLARVVNGVPQQLVTLLSAFRDKLEQEAA